MNYLWINSKWTGLERRSNSW